MRLYFFFSSRFFLLVFPTFRFKIGYGLSCPWSKLAVYIFSPFLLSQFVTYNLVMWRSSIPHLALLKLAMQHFAYHHRQSYISHLALLKQVLASSQHHQHRRYPHTHVPTTTFEAIYHLGLGVQSCSTK